jgi:N-acetylneuraminic acid mutarotase
MFPSVQVSRLRVLLVAGLIAASSFAVIQVASAQTTAPNEWTWISGSSTLPLCTTSCGQPPVYGTLGTPSPGNVPAGVYGASSWTGSNGQLWLFGGLFNDLWEFNPSTSEWAWMGGSTGADQNPGVYGTLGTPAAGNTPGARNFPASWADKSGNFWLFGGIAFVSVDYFGEPNDLWEFNPSTNQWAWMGGSSTTGQPGVYGTLGTPAAGNIPGNRFGASSWTDSNGHLWLFGGVGLNPDGALVYFNDLWEFDPSTNEWAWMSGSSSLPANCNNPRTGVCDQPGVYGSMGVAAAGNVPGSRQNVSSWTDNSGNLWLFGGNGYDADGVYGWLNDLWEFNPSTREWAWMGGGSTFPANCGNGLNSGSPCYQPGAYGTLGTPAAGNFPGGRQGASSWTDDSGHLWLFGGLGYDAFGTFVYLNDLWEFSPFTDEWAWMGGSSTVGSNCEGGMLCGTLGEYGALGTPEAGNIPGGRQFASGWVDASGNLWLFGGNGYDGSGNFGFLNDLWVYQPPPATTPGKITPLVTVTPGSSSITTAQALTVTIAVSGGSGDPTPTGSVTLSGGGYTSAAATLTSGSASINIPAGSLAKGTGTLSAAYTPDFNSASTYNTATGTSSAVTVTTATNPAPFIGSMSPGFANAGGAAFTLTVDGLGFSANSAVIFGTSALAATYVSATQLTAQVPAASITTEGAYAVTVQTPPPGGGSSSSLTFEVDSATGSATVPTFLSTTATVTAGSPASYSVTLPSTVESASVSCLNLPPGAGCSYSSANTVTIATTSVTPPGTYQITIVFAETVSGAASGWILLPILLLPLVFLRKRLAARGAWITACLGLVLLAATAFSTGCGGGGSSQTQPPPQTHQVTSSGAVTLIVQ